MTHSIYDPLPNGLISVDCSGVINDINAAAVAAPVWEHSPRVGARLTQCISEASVKSWLSTFASGEIAWQQGDSYWQLSLLQSSSSNILLQLVDQTEKVTLQKKNQRLQLDIERLDFAAQGANLGIWDFNPAEGKIIGNRTWATQKKLDSDEVFADGNLFSEIVNGIEKWATLVHPDDLEATQQKIVEHLEGKTDVYHAEFRVKCGDGSWKWILDQGKVFKRDADGNPIRMNGIHADIDKLKELQQKLSEMKEKAEVANRAKSIFLANMSHELRTPLNAVLGYSQLMKSEPELPVKHKEYLDIINRSGEHLLALINNVLDMSKIDAGYNVVDLKWFNLRDMVEEVVDLMQMKANQKQLSFRAFIRDDVPSYVKGDEVKTRQVLINLIGNAIKFTDIGQVSLEVNNQDTHPNKDKISFKIIDSGIGISSADLERIFRPFEQVAFASTQNGTGLGLSISKQFVELMGGTLEVRSEIGKGSEFGFSLKLESSDWVECGQTTQSPQVAGLSAQSWVPKVLIAEDQSDNQTLLMTLLTNAGFRVKLAQDGEEAVSLFKSWQPDFIWMDNRMPKMDGLEATKAIRQLENGSQVRIVALTASVFNDEIESMLKAGMDDFARKPSQPNTLLNMMKKHLDIEYDYLDKEETVATPQKLDAAQLKNCFSTVGLQKILTAIEQGDQHSLSEQILCASVAENIQQPLLLMTEAYQFDELYELFSFARESESG